MGPTRIIILRKCREGSHFAIEIQLSIVLAPSLSPLPPVYAVYFIKKKSQTGATIRGIFVTERWSAFNWPDRPWSSRCHRGPPRREVPSQTGCTGGFSSFRIRSIFSSRSLVIRTLWLWWWPHLPRQISRGTISLASPPADLSGETCHTRRESKVRITPVHRLLRPRRSSGISLRLLTSIFPPVLRRPDCDLYFSQRRPQEALRQVPRREDQGTEGLDRQR